jgi:hypothetical protein
MPPLGGPIQVVGGDKPGLTLTLCLTSMALEPDSGHIY